MNRLCFFPRTSVVLIHNFPDLHILGLQQSSAFSIGRTNCQTVVKTNKMWIEYIQDPVNLHNRPKNHYYFVFVQNNNLHPLGAKSLEKNSDHLTHNYLKLIQRLKH